MGLMGGLFKAGKSIGSAGYGMAAGLGKAIESGAVTGGKAVIGAGTVGVKTAKFIGKSGGALGMGVDKSMGGVLGGGVSFNSTLHGMGRAIKGFSEKMVKETATGNGIKLSGMGKAAVLTGALYGGTRDEVVNSQERQMGMNTGVTRATPTMMPMQQAPHSMNHAGATGDLVFAMHKNRRG